VPTVISNPASFSSVRSAFETRGYGAVNSSLLAYRQGGGIVPSSSTFNSIGAGTVGDTLNLSQFSGFSVPDLLRFTTTFTAVNNPADATKFNVSTRASSGNYASLFSYFVLRSNKTSSFGGSQNNTWNTQPGTSDDGPIPGFPLSNYAYGPNSWGSEDVVSSGYQARVNVTEFAQGNEGDGSYLRWGYSGSYHTITGTGFTPYYTLSSDTYLDMETPYEIYALGTLEIRSIAFPSVQISTNWYLECNNNA
jgi:hypothetical protein